MARSRGGSSRSTHEIPADHKRKKVAASSPDSSSSSSSEDEAAPTPSQPPRGFTFLPNRFRNRSKQQRFINLEGRLIIAGRPIVDLLPLLEFSDEFTRRKWTKVGQPEESYNAILIREFYANAYPTKPDSKDRVSWVRGVSVPYSPEAINAYLHTEYAIPAEDDYQKLKHTAMDEDMSTLVLETLSLPGSQYQIGTRNQPTHILKSDLKSVVRLWQAVMYSNILPLTHTSDITNARARMIFCIMQQRDVDIATLISDDMHAIVLSKPSKSGAVRPLAFPGLITGMCKAKGVRIPQPLTPIRKKIDHVFVNSRCYNRREFPRSSDSQSQPPPPVSAPQAPPLGPFDFSSMQDYMAQQFQHIEQRHQLEMAHLCHVQLQQAANHRGQLALHSYFYNYTLHQADTGGSLYPWPTPEQFQRAILWPGDNPVFPGGGDAQPHQGEQVMDSEGEQAGRNHDGEQVMDSEGEQVGEEGGDDGSLSPTF
uniref:Putative plant transposon protein domain-containing protein n=1 Tax=Cajanus cajan TaxID=3821 RepID=A0A151TC79_CAJCA|nr:hypothetical protein KK1_019225 [Cajanus cajan]